MIVATTAHPRTLTVASVPSGHVYVRHLQPEPDVGVHTGSHMRAGVVRLPDPPPLGVRSAHAGQWWPPAMLGADWVEQHAGQVDLFHLHFGFDALDPDELRHVVETVRGHGTPFVYTVHDLRNPHHHDRAAHDAHLDVLVPAADALVTLTPGAAAEIRRRWGRDAVVVPHPHVVPLARMQALSPRGDRPFTVGLHLKSLRASMAPARVVPTLVDVVADLPGAVLQVNAHRDVLEAGGPRHDAGLARLLRDHADAGRIDLRVHDYLSDADLHDYVESLDVSVLPYRFGTHSGWLEMCRDLGTTVVAPSCGYFAEQGPVLTYGHDEAHYDGDALADAVRHAWAERPDLGASTDERRAQRDDVAAAHQDLYARLVEGRP